MKIKPLQVTSHSQLGVFESCAKKFEYEYILKQRIKQQADHFLIGTQCHKALEDRHKLGIAVLPSLAATWVQWLRDHRLGHLRVELEKLMDAKVFIELWVKVRSGWADDEARVRSFGYG